MYEQSREATAFWDWVQWSRGEDEAIATAPIPFRIEKTFVTVSPLASPRKPAWDEQSDDASTAGSTAATESDGSVKDHKAPELCKAATSPDLRAEARSYASRRSASSPPRLTIPLTVMLRNLPNRAKQARVEEHLIQLGFTQFQLHLPIDARTGVNKGYAFVRLPDERMARAFCDKVDGTQLPGPQAGSGSRKKLAAVVAASQERVPVRKRQSC